MKISDFGKSDNFFQKVVKFFGNFLYIENLFSKSEKISIFHKFQNKFQKWHFQKYFFRMDFFDYFFFR